MVDWNYFFSSAGLGRSGTLIIVHSVLAKVKYEMRNFPDREPTINVPEILIAMRKQRPGLVQTEVTFFFFPPTKFFELNLGKIKEQYLFCYLAISDGLAKMTSKEKESDYVEFSFIRQKVLEGTKEDND